MAGAGGSAVRAGDDDGQAAVAEMEAKVSASSRIWFCVTWGDVPGGQSR